MRAFLITHLVLSIIGTAHLVLSLTFRGRMPSPPSGGVRMASYFLSAVSSVWAAFLLWGG